MLILNSLGFLGYYTVSGVDVPNVDIKDFDTTDLDACAQSCSGTSGCLMFSFDETKKHCWLKNKQGTGILKPGVTLGLFNTSG